MRAADNLLTGSLADYTRADGSPLASRIFNLSRNVLDGGPLPAAWHSPSLRVLDVSYNRVPGGLPAAWAAPAAGQRSAFPALETLAVQGNALEGQYPYGNGSAFASNFTIIARPGNGLLEGVPAPPPAPAAAEDGGGLSGGAIAGIVIGCVAAAGALEAGVGWLLCCGVHELPLRSRAALWPADSALLSPRHPLAALVAVLAAYAMRRRQRSVAAAAAGTAADCAAAGKDGWGKDLESGAGGDSAGGSAWGSLSSRPPPGGGSAGLRDSAMASQATARTDSGGEGTHHSGSGGTAGDTDVRRLPAEWATIDFSELELSSVLVGFGVGMAGRRCGQIGAPALGLEGQARGCVGRG